MRDGMQEMFNKFIPYYEVFGMRQSDYENCGIEILGLNKSLESSIAENGLTTFNDLIGMSRKDVIQKCNFTDEEIGKIESALKKLSKKDIYKEISVEAINDGNINKAEKDMEVYESNKNAKFMERLFCENPLIGNRLLNENALREINTLAKKCLDTVVENPSYILPLEGNMAITIATVNYAKKWDASNESKLTRFITMQFGYRDDSGNVWKLIGKSIERAMIAKKRLFIVDSNGREFYETVLVHSFGPERAWDSVFDLLFDFLKNNLRWRYIKEDPTIEKMVEILKRRFEGNNADDDELIISSTEYRIKLGARRLIKYRPLYATRLFNHALEKMVACISGDAVASNLYIDQLIEEWYSRKVGRLAFEDKKQISRGGAVSGDREDTAFTYSKIRTSLLCKNGRIYVHIPAIRLQDENIKETEVKLFCGEKIVGRSYVEVYGNELGKTVNSADIMVPEGTNIGKLSVSIICDGKEIYTSEKSHWKDILVFKNGKESSFNSIKKGIYEFFISDHDGLQLDNIIVIEKNNTGQYFEAKLKDGYVIKYHGRIMALDVAAIMDTEITPPKPFEGVRLYDGIDYYEIVSASECIEVITKPEQNLELIKILVDGNPVSVGDFIDKSHENNIIAIPVGAILTINEVHEIVIADFASGKTIYKKTSYFVNDFDFWFDRPFYYDASDYEGALLRWRFNGNEYEEAVTEGVSTIDVSFGESGDAEIAVPSIKAKFIGMSQIYQGNYIWHKDVTNNSQLVIENNTGIKCAVEYGDKKTTLREIQIKHLIKDDIGNAEFSKPIYLEIGDKQYVLAQIVFSSMFTRPPVFSMSEDVILWDGGTSYIGDNRGDLELRLYDKDEERYSFPIYLGKSEVVGTCAVDDANYVYQIIEKQAHKETVLAQDSYFFGNPNKTRFDNAVIHIEEVTEDVEAGTEVITIKPVYIDKIQYVGREYVPSEEGAFDIYEGQMYFIKFDGTKRYYSRRAGEKGDLFFYQVNPVRIIYINDRYLRIVNSDEEGLYCYDNFGTIPRHEITDREPPKKARNYKDILFYIYEVIKVDGKSLTISEKTWEGEKKQTDSIFDRFILKEQLEVISASVSARIMVNAGPGTGKTWALLQRIKYLVDVEEVDPEEIIVLCFSRAAVEVVRTRLSEATEKGEVSDVINYVDVRTFDSFASQLLYWIKENDPDELKYLEISSLDYDARIKAFTDVIEKKPEYISQCAHLLVDEVQDLVRNRARMVISMIRNLPEESGITLLGDYCQGIYDYQISTDDRMGSDQFYSVICEKIKGFEYVTFTRNYRQTDWLAQLGDGYRKEILSCNFKRYNDYWKSVVTKQIDEFDVTCVEDWVADDIEEIVENGTVGILTRTNGEALIISDCLRKKNIEHVLKRRLSVNYLHKWLGIVLNTMAHSSITYEQFYDTYLSCEFGSGEDAEVVWQGIQEVARTSADIIGIRDLLKGLLMTSAQSVFYEDERTSNLVVTNIHRGKGKEFDTVLIEDSIFRDEDKQIDEHKVDYVALTRPRDNIYKIHIDNDYMNIDKYDRRCFKAVFGHNGKKHLSRFEVGLGYDLDLRSFNTIDGVQEYLRENYEDVIGKKIRLVKKGIFEGVVEYAVIIEENGMVIGKTSAGFYEALARAIRSIHRIPSSVQLYYRVFPEKITDVYIDDVVSVVDTSDGAEKGVNEFGEMIVWNVATIIGFGTAIYA